MTSTLLRGIPIAALTQVYGRRLVEELRGTETAFDDYLASKGQSRGPLAADPVATILAFADQVEGALPPSRQKPSDREIANAYREAVRRGAPATRAVADHFGVSVTRAAQWVQRARGKPDGLGKAPGRGRQGEVKPGGDT